MDSIRDEIRSAWQISNRATTFLVEHIPDALWTTPVPGTSRRTVQRIGAHLHNNRCSWVRAMGKKLGIGPPERVDERRVSPGELVAALDHSSLAMLAMIDAAIERGGRMPAAEWQNFPAEVVHFLVYHAAHEAHHRGQIVMLARQLGHRLPDEVTNGLWQWSRFRRELAHMADR